MVWLYHLYLNKEYPNSNAYFCSELLHNTMLNTGCLLPFITNTNPHGPKDQGKCASIVTLR